MYVNRKEEEEGETEQQQTYQFTQGLNILYRLQDYLTLTFIMHNKYISTLYLYTYTLIKSTIIQFVTLLAEFRFVPELTIYGVLS